jgi:uncharacterized protein (DUF1800 family)
MLIWLDSNSNKRGNPNENYARELMEPTVAGTSGSARRTMTRV